MVADTIVRCPMAMEVARAHSTTLGQNAKRRWYEHGEPMPCVLGTLSVAARRIGFYLSPYSPELNMIEILWKQAKYHWRYFVIWTKETIGDEVRNLLDGYGTKFQISFA